MKKAILTLLLLIACGVTYADPIPLEPPDIGDVGMPCEHSPLFNPATGEVQSYIGNSAIVTTLNPKETIICVSAHNRIPFIQTPDVLYIQNTNITGTLDETHDMIKVGNHVTTIMETGDVTTSSADITLRANEVVLDSGTEISVGSSLKIINP